MIDCTAGVVARGLYVYGVSGHGRVVADVCRLLGYELVAFLDDAPALVGGTAAGQPILAGVALGDLPRGTRVALGIGSNTVRARLLERCRALGLSLPTLVHPAATVSAGVVLGEATLVAAKAVLNPGTGVGAAAIINTGAIIDHDCHVGEAAHVSPGAVLAGGVTLGPLAHVGAGAVVLPGRRIGDRAVVGAGAVVTRNVDADTVVLGVPARPRLEERNR